jgi:phosphoribosylformylglycinamidine cyclo-ligase
VKNNAYAQAGVDIELGNKVKAALPKLLKEATRPEVMGKVGNFGGLFAFNLKKYEQPVLVSSTDGVGTKLKIAFMTGRHNTVGQDLLNHCVNDIAVLGAEPLFFLDYIGTAKLEPNIFEQLISGLALACKENHCALIGGETAQMPGFYKPGEYDICGTIIGAVDKKAIVTGKAVQTGDVVIGLESTGLHTNGYSLARKIFFEKLKLKTDSFIKELNNTVGDELLKVHKSYGQIILKALRKFNKTAYSTKAKDTLPIRALAHITGGGFFDNIPRVIPNRFDVIIKKGSWPVLPIFSFIQKAGKISDHEMYHVFNMGIGLVFIVDKLQADNILKWIKNNGSAAWVIGEITKGTGKVFVK